MQKDRNLFHILVFRFSGLAGKIEKLQTFWTFKKLQKNRKYRIADEKMFKTGTMNDCMLFIFNSNCEAAKYLLYSSHASFMIYLCYKILLTEILRDYGFFTSDSIFNLHVLVVNNCNTAHK